MLLKRFQIVFLTAPVNKSNIAKPCGKCTSAFQHLLLSNKEKISGPYVRKMEEAKQKKEAFLGRIKDVSNRITILKKQQLEIENSIKIYQEKCAQIQKETEVLERSLTSRSF